MFFNHRQEIITRNYDVAGSGFAPLPTKLPPKLADDHKFHWTIGLVKDLCAVFYSIFLASIGYGILLVMIAFKMETHIKNEILMSLSAATQIGAGVIFSRFLPSIGRKAGIINGIYFGSIVSAICALLTYFYPGYLLWLLIIFGLGTSLFICGVSRNTIMINLAPPHMRAVIISIGTMLVAIGNSLGPVILSIIQTHDHFITFLLASSFYLASMLPLSRLKKIDSDNPEEKKLSIWRYIRASPKIMFASFAVNFSTSSATTFSIIYGIKIGMPPNQASLLVSVLLFGTIFSIPVGYLADIVNRRLMMLSCAGLAFICASLLFFNHEQERIYTLLFLMFGFLAGVKVPAMVLVNEKYKPTQRLAVNSVFSRMGLIGNICGLFCTGSLMKQMGPNGLWLSISTILFLFLLFCSVHYYRKIKRKEFNLRKFSFLHNPNRNELLPDI